MAYFKSEVQPFIKAFIISDALLYSSLNLVNILFVGYATTKVPGGTVQSATVAIAIGLTARMVTELLAGRTSSQMSESKKLQLIIGGMAMISAGYAGFAFFHSIAMLTSMWVLNGIGWGLAFPAKLALVAKHINHDQSSQEWGVTDAINMTLIVITMLIGSVVVTHFKYELIFIIAAAINTLGIAPYSLYARKRPAAVVEF